MSKFNLTQTKPKTLTTNLAGGQAYRQTPELEIISILLTSFVNDQFYHKSNETLDRLKDLLDKVEPKFAAKAAICVCFFGHLVCMRCSIWSRSLSLSMSGSYNPCSI